MSHLRGADPVVTSSLVQWRVAGHAAFHRLLHKKAPKPSGASVRSTATHALAGPGTSADQSDAELYTTTGSLISPSTHCPSTCSKNDLPSAGRLKRFVNDMGSRTRRLRVVLFSPNATCHTKCPHHSIPLELHLSCCVHDIRDACLQAVHALQFDYKLLPTANLYFHLVRSQAINFGIPYKRYSKYARID